MIRMPEHPAAHKNGYVYEYRVIAEVALGRYLPASAVIHHVNGDESDNRPCNLVICQDAAYHRVLHGRTNAYRATGNANALPCNFCHVYDVPANMTIRERSSRSYGVHAYHAECRNAYRKAKRASAKERGVSV